MARIAIISLFIFVFLPDWQRYESKECGFAADFPGKVSKRVFSVELENPQYAFFSYPDSTSISISYSVNCIDQGKDVSQIKNLKDKLDKHIQRGVADKIESFNRLTFKGKSARRTTAPIDSLVIHRLLFYEGHFSYDLTVVEEKGKTKNVERFFNSFELLNK